jgi:hypothetical protein
MDRREAINRVVLLFGGTVIGAEFFLSGCKSGSSFSADDLFEKDTVAYMNQIGETILPATSTPGAAAANVGGFMAIMVRDCYDANDQKVFKQGLKTLDEACVKKFDKGFMKAEDGQRTALLNELDKEQKEYSKTKKEDAPNHYFTMLKQLTLLGYFTSEVGCTKALRYVPVPGKYIGDYPYMKGDKAWALA